MFFSSSSTVKIFLPLQLKCGRVYRRNFRGEEVENAEGMRAVLLPVHAHLHHTVDFQGFVTCTFGGVRDHSYATQGPQVNYVKVN